MTGTIKLKKFSDLSSSRKEQVSSSFLGFMRAESTLPTFAHDIKLNQAIAAYYGYHFDILVFEYGTHDTVIGFFPYSIVGKRLISVPHFSYGGFLGLTQHREDCERLIEGYCLKFKSFLNRGGSNRSSALNKVSGLLVLEQTAEKQFSCFSSKLRSQIRSKSKELAGRIVHKMGKLSLLSDFYKLYFRRMVELGSPPLPESFFKLILSSEFNSHVQIFACYIDGVCTASSICISFGEWLEVVWSSSERRYNKYSVNLKHYWFMMQECINCRVYRFSFGRATLNSTSAAFKKQWGCNLVPLNWKKEQNLDEHSKILREISPFLFCYLPTGLQKFIGHAFNRYMP